MLWGERNLLCSLISGLVTDGRLDGRRRLSGLSYWQERHTRRRPAAAGVVHGRHVVHVQMCQLQVLWCQSCIAVGDANVGMPCPLHHGIASHAAGGC
jgi:hypothetical protein